MDKIITLEELLNKHFKIINEAVENAGGIEDATKQGQSLQPVAQLGGIFHVQSFSCCQIPARFSGTT